MLSLFDATVECRTIQSGVGRRLFQARRVDGARREDDRVVIRPEAALGVGALRSFGGGDGTRTEQR